MANTTEELRIWKHSHGTTKTTRWSDDEREEFKAGSILTIGHRLEQLQVENFKKMQPGDFFYLCHGNDIQLLGRITSQVLNPREACLKRKYATVRVLPPGPWPFRRHRKAWSPSGDTTCWPVPEPEHLEFEEDILKPFFDMSLTDLRRWVKQARRKPHIEAAELVPPPGPPEPYKPRRGARGDFRRSESSVRLYDPDLTGRRKGLHERCLARFSRLFRHCAKFKKRYDLVVRTKAKVLLVEAKTLQGDADQQLRLALGQVLYYEHLCVEPSFPGCKVFRLVLTDRVPPDYMVRLLERHNVGVVWILKGRERGQSKLASHALRAFGGGFNLYG